MSDEDHDKIPIDPEVVENLIKALADLTEAVAKDAKRIPPEQEDDERE